MKMKEKEKPKEEPKPEDKIALANAAAARIEAANKKAEELIQRQEALAVEKTLAGSADAGQPEEKKDPAAELAKKILEGSGEEGIIK